MTKQGICYVRYVDHVAFFRAVALDLNPQIREALGWLTFENDEYIIIQYDRDAGLPTLKGGDSKASGLVLLKSAILEIRRLA
jgi:hypothetical protein